MQKVYFINCMSLGFFIYLCTHLFLTLSSYFYFNNLILYGTSIVSSIKSLLNTIWDTDNNSDIHKFYSLNLSMEKVMSPHSSTLAWQIPWAEEPGRLQSMGSLGVRHDWVTSLSCTGEGHGNPLQCSCLENPRDRGAWWAAVSGVTQSWTRLKWLSSSSSSSIEMIIWFLIF